MEIYCEFKNWSAEFKIYTCFVHSASITSQGLEIIKFIGEHETGKTNKDVNSIKFLNTEVHYFPRGLNKIFPNLMHVWIENCGLKEISREDLKGLEKIYDLYVKKNELKTLPNDLFEGMKNLCFISFPNNKLEFVSSKLFLPFRQNQLRTVDFQGNPTINAVYKRGKENPTAPFIDLPGLKKTIDEKCKSPPIVLASSSSQTTEKVQTSTAVQTEKQNENLKNKFIQGFSRYWTTGELSDFTIIVSDRKFQVHKSVLAMQSKFFQKTFTESSIKELEINWLSAEAVEEVLRWIYTEETPTAENAEETFALSSKLEISDLVAITELLILENLNDENVMEVFKLGNRHGSQMIMKTTFDEIKNIIDEPELNENLMKKPEELEKYFEAKKNVLGEMFQVVKKLGRIEL